MAISPLNDSCTVARTSSPTRTEISIFLGFGVAYATDDSRVKAPKNVLKISRILRYEDKEMLRGKPAELIYRFLRRRTRGERIQVVFVIKQGPEKKQIPQKYGSLGRYAGYASSHPENSTFRKRLRRSLNYETQLPLSFAAPRSNTVNSVSTASFRPVKPDSYHIWSRNYRIIQTSNEENFASCFACCTL